MKELEGFVVKGKEGHVLRQRKALYGLKQASRAWYFKLHQCFISLGFIKSNHKQSLYLKRSSIDTLSVGVYVDNLIVTGSSTDIIDAFKAEMKLKFEMSDLGSLSSYLGLEVKQEHAYICLSHKAYAQNWHIGIQKLAYCNVVSAPLEAQAKFTYNEGSDKVNVTNFRSLIGSLRYLTHTRPYLLYYVGILNRYMKKPS